MFLSSRSRRLAKLMKTLNIAYPSHLNASSMVSHLQAAEPYHVAFFGAVRSPSNSRTRSGNAASAPLPHTGTTSMLKVDRVPIVVIFKTSRGLELLNLDRLLNDHEHRSSLPLNQGQTILSSILENNHQSNPTAI
jgi:hypothetical protein